jgi:flagellin
MAITAATNLGAMAAKRFMEINNTGAIRSADQLGSGSTVSNPTYNPSAAAIGYRLGAQIAALTQASSNVSQASSMIQMGAGALGATNDVLKRMKEIAVQANSDSLGANERAMLVQEFTQLINQVDLNATNARWGGTSLFTGSGSTATGQATAAAQSATGLTAVANAFANTLDAATQGFITGTATAATVTANGGLYNVSVTIGSQTFSNTVAAPTAGGVLTLISTTDPNSSIAFDYAGSVAAITNATTFQTSLQSLLGLTSGSARASFASLATTNNGMANVTFNPGAGTTAGSWALSYTYNSSNTTGTFRLSNGISVYTANISNPGATLGSQQTVSFGNGTTLTLSSSFAGQTNHAQEMYTVTAGTTLTQQFQYGELASDVLQVTFSSASASALGVNALDVSTTANAQAASNAIDNAMQVVSNQIAVLGGKSSQLNFMMDTLKINIQNKTAARSTFVDANISDSMMALQRFKTLYQVASSVFTNSLNDQSMIAQMVQQVR